MGKVGVCCRPLFFRFFEGREGRETGPTENKGGERWLERAGDPPTRPKKNLPRFFRGDSVISNQNRYVFYRFPIARLQSRDRRGSGASHHSGSTALLQVMSTFREFSPRDPGQVPSSAQGRVS